MSKYLYLQKSISERSAHLKLDDRCRTKGPITGEQLCEFLGIEGLEDLKPKALCNNPKCGNPEHYLFTAKGEAWALLKAERERRLRYYILETPLGNASMEMLAAKCYCSRNVVRRILDELGMRNRPFINTRDGFRHNPQRYYRRDYEAK